MLLDQNGKLNQYTLMECYCVRKYQAKLVNSGVCVYFICVLTIFIMVTTWCDFMYFLYIVNVYWLKIILITIAFIDIIFIQQIIFTMSINDKTIHINNYIYWLKLSDVMKNYYKINRAVNVKDIGVRNYGDYVRYVCKYCGKKDLCLVCYGNVRCCHDFIDGNMHEDNTNSHIYNGMLNWQGLTSNKNNISRKPLLMQSYIKIIV